MAATTQTYPFDVYMCVCDDIEDGEFRMRYSSTGYSPTIEDAKIHLYFTALANLWRSYFQIQEYECDNHQITEIFDKVIKYCEENDLNIAHAFNNIDHYDMGLTLTLSELKSLYEYFTSEQVWNTIEYAIQFNGRIESAETTEIVFELKYTNAI